MRLSSLIARFLRQSRRRGLNSEAGLTCVIFFLSLPVASPRENLLTRNLSKRLLSYVFLYLLVDREIDDWRVPADQKISFVIAILEAGASGTMPCHSLWSKRMSKYYQFLVLSSENPNVFSPVILSTATSFIAQYSRNSTPRDLFNACCDKGGSSVLCGYRTIFERECWHPDLSDSQLYKLGACIQMLDDIADCSEDRRQGINTLATHCLSLYSHLDNMVHLLCLLVETLAHPLEDYKKSILICLRVVIHKSGNFTCKLRESFNLSRYK